MNKPEILVEMNRPALVMGAIATSAALLGLAIFRTKSSLKGIERSNEMKAAFDAAVDTGAEMLGEYGEDVK